jgi:hypothetical protein
LPTKQAKENGKWKRIYTIYNRDLKLDIFNGVYDFILFKILKRVLILTSYIPLNIESNENDYISKKNKDNN